SSSMPLGTWCCAVSILASSCLSSSFQLFFFFQAEDGIRDYKVTGVQTCALPISVSPRDENGWFHRQWKSGASDLSRHVRRCKVRSEERRVGKECRSRWSPYH